MIQPVITVVGGGWSAALVDMTRLPGFVIAVNDAATFAPKWNAALSMDRLWAENRIDVIARRVAELGVDRKLYLRENALQNLENYRALWPFVEPFECNHEETAFNAAAGRLNGTNSGMCAINLAWKMSPKVVYLVGFDMNRSPSGQPYWYPPYPWAAGGSTSAGKYAKWSKQFDDAAAAFRLINCEVYNVSQRSSINAFPKISPDQLAAVA